MCWFTKTKEKPVKPGQIMEIKPDPPTITQKQYRDAIINDCVYLYKKTLKKEAPMLADHELDTIARQRIGYVVIERHNYCSGMGFNFVILPLDPSNYSPMQIRREILKQVKAYANSRVSLQRL